MTQVVKLQHQAQVHFGHGSGATGYTVDFHGDLVDIIEYFNGRLDDQGELILPFDQLVSTKQVKVTHVDCPRTPEEMGISH